jgi:AcrR family transcriptional regulator
MDESVQTPTTGEPGPDDTRRARVSSEEAAERLIETTITMLREVPFNELSVRTIAARADLNNSTIDRCFGSINTLFNIASNRLAVRAIAEFADSPELLPYDVPDLGLSVRFRGWLLTGGADPADLRFEPGNTIAQLMGDRQQLMHGVSPWTARVFTQILAFLVEGYTVFNESHAIDDEVRGAMLQLVGQLSLDLPQIEKRLGWQDRAVEDQSL